MKARTRRRSLVKVGDGVGNEVLSHDYTVIFLDKNNNLIGPVSSLPLITEKPTLMVINSS